jgi:hypothetical protein
MQHYFAQTIAPLVAANKAFDAKLRADRYMLSNRLMRFAANNDGHMTPGLPEESGFFLLRAMLKHQLAVWNP